MSVLRRLIVAAVVAPALAIPFGCGRGERAKLTLRYHPPAGATYRYDLEQQTEIKFESGPMAKMPVQHLGLHMHFTQMVAGPTAEGVGMTVRFDSTTMESPLMAKSGYGPALDRMRGLTSKVVYDDRMNVLHAEFTNLGEDLAGVTDQIGQNLKGMTFPLPAEPVGVGDSWTAEMELPLHQVASGGSPMMATTKLTVKEINAGGPDTTVLIALRTSFPADPIKVAQQGQLLTLKLSGTLTGDQLFSLTRGAVVQSQVSGTMGIHMTGGALGADGADMSTKQVTSLQLREAK